MNKDEYKMEEMRYEAQKDLEAVLFDEFREGITDMQIAKEMIEHGEPEMTFEEMEEILFAEYCETRD